MIVAVAAKYGIDGRPKSGAEAFVDVRGFVSSSSSTSIIIVGDVLAVARRNNQIDVLESMLTVRLLQLYIVPLVVDSW